MIGNFIQISSCERVDNVVNVEKGVALQHADEEHRFLINA